MLYARTCLIVIQAFASRVGEIKNETLGMYQYLLEEGCGNGDPS